MKKSISLVISFLVFFSTNSFSKIAVGYYYATNSTYPHTAVQYDKLTHIAHSFIWPDSSGNIEMDSWFLYPELVSEAHKNGVKIIVALGGWDKSYGFRPVTTDSQLRAKFIQNLVDFCLLHGYDGIDLDWEYPTSEDKANVVSFISELRLAFDNSGLEIISIAIPANDWGDGYDIYALQEYVDWFGVMTFEYSGLWDTKAGLNSPLYSSSNQFYSTDKNVNLYLAKGLPQEKLCIGMAFYGYNFKASSLYSSFDIKESSSITYVDANLKKVNEGWQYLWDDVCKVPYLQNAEQTRVITYDDSISIKLKSEYVNKNNLAGTIIWKLGDDYSNGQSDLLSMVKKYLLNSTVTQPGIPVLSLPEENSTQDYNLIILRWNPTDSTTSYNIQIDTSNKFANPIIYKKGINLNYYTHSNLQQNKTYYWRVSSANIAGTGDWSEIRSFKTDQATYVGENLNQPEEFELSNYPNPFNPITKIRYSIPATSHVTLKIFNLLGREIASLVDDEMKSSGTYEMEFDATGLASGTYFCQMNTDNHLLIQKMVVEK